MFMYANDVHYDVLDAYVHVRQWRGLRQGRWRKRPDATSTASKTGLQAEPLLAIQCIQDMLATINIFLVK